MVGAENVGFRRHLPTNYAVSGSTLSLNIELVLNKNALSSFDRYRMLAFSSVALVILVEKSVITLRAHSKARWL